MLETKSSIHCSQQPAKVKSAEGNGKRLQKYRKASVTFNLIQSNQQWHYSTGHITSYL